MMRWLRWAAVSLVAAGALWSLDRFCVRAWKCNAIVTQVERTTEAMYAHADSFVVKARARANIDLLQPCLEGCGAARRTQALVAMAANYRILNDREHALAAYRESLKIDWRPEIYLNLAEVEYESGRREAAIRHYAMVMAVAPFMIDYVPGAPVFETANHIPTDILPAVLAMVPEARQALMRGERGG
jgi:tetratricopeptide (TPR) repeat protein